MDEFAKKHPAKFSEPLLPVFDKILSLYSCKTVLDPFAGTGKIHLLDYDTVGVEIEEEWSNLHIDTVCADSTKLPFANESFDSICTSPTYGNRMADSHKAKDSSTRNTYTHKLGRDLSENNSGKMHFGKRYKELHIDVWTESYRVLNQNGIFILNFKNHIKKGVEIDVFSWHIASLINIGLTVRSVEQVPLKGNGFGANRNARVPFEYVAVLQKLPKQKRINKDC